MEAQAAEARAERWTHTAAVVLTLASAAPAAYLIGERNRAEIVRRLEDLGSWSRDGASDLTAAESGAFTLGIPVMAATGGAFVLLLWLRRAATQRALRRGEATDDRQRLTTWVLTVGAWTALVAGLVVFGAAMVAAGEPNTSDAAQNFVDEPAWALLAVAGIGFGSMSSVWHHRRAHGLTVRIGEGEVPATNHQRGQPVRLQEGLRNYGRAMVVEGGFGVAGLARALFATDGVALADYAIEWVVMAVVAPAMISGAFMAILWARPTRWMVAEAFAQPLTKVALGGLAAGLVLALAGGDRTLVVALGLALALGGGLLAGITGLYLLDVGPQPRLGILFIVILYVANAFTTDGGDIGLPADAYSWVAAAALAFFVIRECRGLWRLYYRKADPAPSVAPG